MRIAFAGNKERGLSCLGALLDSRHEPVAVLVHPGARGELTELARRSGLPVHAPEDVNDTKVVALLRSLEADVIVLAGYGKIVGPEVLASARYGTLNLHAGRLPQYRGSSPLNWALINGETEFTLSIIQADAGVDTGDVLLERTFPIDAADSIADLHRVANTVFPELLLATLAAIEGGTARPRRQDESEAAYYPLRFPDDGLVLWDTLTAEQAHNRVRALTDPYPGAFTFHEGRRVRLLSSRLSADTVFGEPGRVYRTTQDGILVCASDRCVWIDRATTDDGGDALPLIKRYDVLATVRRLAVQGLPA